MINIFRKFRYQYEYFKLLIRQNGFRSAIGEAVYFNREMVLVERDLSKPLPSIRRGFDMEIVLLDGKNMGDINKYEFANNVRKQKGLTYLSSGFSVILGIKGNKVIAEQWWTTSEHVKKNIKHQDLRWMELNLKNGEIYAFDLFITPEYRGTPATNKFLHSYISEFKKMGFCKIYGCFFLDNIQSLWVHRMFSYDETRRVKRHRFFFLEIKNGKLCFA